VDSWDITVSLVAGAVLLVGSFMMRGVVRRRLISKSGGSAVDVPYYDVDSLDYGFGGSRGAGPSGGGPRLYTERWLMLFLYSLNMATLSVLASTLPSSQLPAEQLYGVTAYPIVTLMSVLVFLSLPATIASSVLNKRFGIRGTCCVALAISLVGAWIIAAAAFTSSWYLQITGTVVMGLGAPMLANACTGLSAKWFGVDERNLPTALGSMIPGAVAGAVFNYIAVTKKELLPLEFVLVAIMCTVAAVRRSRNP
jgi:MFS family permease